MWNEILILNAVLIVCLILSAVTDVLYGKIYNYVTYSAVVAGVILNTVFYGEAGLRVSFFGFAIGFGPFLILCLLGVINGGDVKLLAAIGALRGYPFIIRAIFLSFLVAAFFALAKMIWKGQVVVTIKRVFTNLMNLVIPGRVIETYQNEETIPFGLAACIGTLWALTNAGLDLSA